MRIGLILIAIMVWGISFSQNPFDAKKKTIDEATQQAPNAGLNTKALINARQTQMEVKTFEPQTLIYDNDIQRVTAEPKVSNYALNTKINESVRVRAGATKAQLDRSIQTVLNQLNKKIIQENPDQEWSFRSMNTDANGEQHIRLSQVYNGVPVFGGEIILHSKNRLIDRATGRYFVTPDIETTPQLSFDQAANAAMEDVHTHSPVAEITSSAKELLNIEKLEGQLVIYYNDEANAVLAYHYTIRPNIMQRFEYFVDAKSGEILNHFDHTCSIVGPTESTANDLLGVSRTFNTYEDGGTYFMIDAAQSMFSGNLSGNFDGAIATLDMQNRAYTQGQYVEVQSGSINSWDAKAVSAHYNATEAYNYFKNTHGRNSINGQGGNIISFINVEDENSNAMDNAFWNGAAMFYGNGASAFFPLAAGKDVGGHEMTHGVIQNTANLTYQNESGAINESMADVFGVMLDREDWLLGEDVVKLSAFPSGALRSMSDPHNGGNSLNDPGFQPKHTNEQYTGSQDNGGVHINSGIPNYAFYLFATDGSVGNVVAEKVYYHALTNYLTASSNFVDLRLSVENSVTDLYPGDNPKLQAAQNAFAAVGIGSSGGSQGPVDIQTNPGSQFILSYDTDNTNQNTWYLLDINGQTIDPISTTQSRTKPSVTDDGSFAFFVRSDGHIIQKILSGSFDEHQISNSPEWDNVAISKDGKRLAAVTSDANDANIYVFNLTVNPIPGQAFQLYNPTYTQGVETGEVKYADAMEWDYSGEYLMYDAYNVIDNLSGNDYDFWDVGFMRVWNNSANNFGDGFISKMFSSLPQNISIGEPSFSKNSPNIITFDEINFETGNFTILNADIENGQLVGTFVNDILNQPNYSMEDDQQIFNVVSNNVQYVGIYDLQSDKLTISGQASTHIVDAKWGVWYAAGDRQLPTPVEEQVIEIGKSNIEVFPNPVSDILKIKLSHSLDKSLKLELIDINGEVVSKQQLAAHNQEKQLDVSMLQSGVYILKLSNQFEQAQVKFLKLH